jgi:hypothetical protein
MWFFSRLAGSNFKGDEKEGGFSRILKYQPHLSEVENTCHILWRCPSSCVIWGECPRVLLIWMIV